MTRPQTKLNEELKAYLEELISPLARKNDLKGLATVQSINQSLVNLEKKLLDTWTAEKGGGGGGHAPPLFE